MKRSRLLFAAVFVSAFLCPAAGHDEGKEMKAYMVSNAHLDTQWNWDVVTTIDEYVKNTLNQNLFLLNMYPDYIFNFEGGVKYSWMKEYYPAEYEQMKKFIENGRWHISGSSWDATDALVPSPESAIRNILLGQTFYRTEFGTEGTDIFLPDCFGFGWTLPTIASHCGLIGFSSQKLDWRNNPFYGDSKLPFTIGLWQGVDGSRIMLAHGYNYSKRWEDEDLSVNRQLKSLASGSPLKTVYRYYGTGDTGGSPTLESVRSVEKGLKGDGPVEIISAASDRLFKDYLPYEKHTELPVFDGELLMDVHGTGCYTSQAAMKLYNRQNEILGDAAERAALAADWMGVAEYPGEILSESWRRFIFHQFHDDLTGTSIPKAYEYSWNDEIISLKQFSDVLTASVGGVASQMDTRTRGVPVILYNGNGFDVEGMVEINVGFMEKGGVLYDKDGKKVPSQMLFSDNGKKIMAAAVKVPANSFTVFDLRKGPGAEHMTAEAVDSFENSIYKVTFDKNGDIVSIFDKKNDRELVMEGRAVRLAVFPGNKSRSWPAWEIMKETLDRTPLSITQDVSIMLVEDGKLRKTVCVKKRFGKSEFTQYIRLYEGPYADRIDFDNEVFWQSTGTLLKAEFPLSTGNEYATYDLGLGAVQRGNNTLTAYEVYAQEWADLTDSDGSYGVTVMNDSKYGWDKPDDNTLRLTLLHTPETGRGHYEYQSCQDFGRHVFSFSISGHAGGLDKAGTCEKAAAYNRPLLAFTTERHPGNCGKSFSFAASSNSKVMIKALKKAEVSDEYVVRVYETEGKEVQEAEITFPSEILGAVVADGTEKTSVPALFHGNTLEVKLSPYGVGTYKVRLKKKDRKAGCIYEPVSLPFDRKCFSWNAFRHEADMGSGYSYPAELLPDSVLVSNGIPFLLGEKEVENGMSCKGDTIPFTAGKFNKLYLLAASADKDNSAEFRLGSSVQTAFIPYFSDFVAQWGHTGHTEGYVKDADIAHVCTHRHSSGGDGIYEFAYMFRITLDIPQDADSVILPDMPGIVIFSATLADENYPHVAPASEIFRTAVNETGREELRKKDNLILGAAVIGTSGEANEKEKAEFAVDGNPETKWCDVTKAPNYVIYDLGEPKEISEWRIVNAGVETSSYITSDCFLFGRNSETEEWRRIAGFADNSRNTVSGTFRPVTCRYVKILVTRPCQDASGTAARIYEIELY